MSRIPYIPFHQIVGQWAFAKGLRYLTVKEKKAAAIHYCIHAQYLN